MLTVCQSDINHISNTLKIIVLCKNSALGNLWLEIDFPL